MTVSRKTFNIVVWVFCCYQSLFMSSGRKVMAGRRTMSGLIVDLTGQTLVLLFILTGHFWMRTFIIFSIWLSLNAFCSITL